MGPLQIAQISQMEQPTSQMEQIQQTVLMEQMVLIPRIALMVHAKFVQLAPSDQLAHRVLLDKQAK
jgi:hypothetical protein